MILKERCIPSQLKIVTTHGPSGSAAELEISAPWLLSTAIARLYFQSGHEIVTRYACSILVVTRVFEHLYPCRMLIQCWHVLDGTHGPSG